jgi:hypothetical protein
VNAHSSAPPADGDAAFDWAGLDSAFTSELESFARSCLASTPRGDVYAVAVYLFYAEAGGRIFHPAFAAASEAWLAALADESERTALRWSPADWPWQRFEAESDPDAWRRWGEALTEEALTNPAGWDTIDNRFADLVVLACRTVAARLAHEDDAAPLVVALDPELELARRTLTEEQLRPLL